MEVERGLGDMVETVGGGGQSGAGVYHETHSSSCKATETCRVIEGRGAVHVQPWEKALQSHPHPNTEPRIQACTSGRQTRAQWLSPVPRAERRWPGFAWGVEDACWV